MVIEKSDSLALDVTRAIHNGDVETLRRLLDQHPELATARIADRANCAVSVERTLLHIATDWPGHFPNGAATVALLADAGADVNARVRGPHSETPLHWAASSDDVAVVDALLDRGADIEATGAVIGGGTPLADAAAFGQWRAARRLVERGAQANLWQAAALGLMDRVRTFFESADPPLNQEVTKAFWCACHGGQRESAEYLIERGAGINWVGYDHLTALDAARRSGAEDLASWLSTRGARSAQDLR
jgi:ankyrin repeat protein